MMNIKRKISIFTLFIVTTVAFLGVICPMTKNSSALSMHDNCTPSLVTISSGDHGNMADCMNGKLGFLSGLLVSMPQQELFALFIVVIIIYSILSGLIKEFIGDNITKVKLRSLLISFYCKVKIQYFQCYYRWLNTVQRPASIA